MIPPNRLDITLPFGLRDLNGYGTFWRSKKPPIVSQQFHYHKTSLQCLLFLEWIERSLNVQHSISRGETLALLPQRPQKEFWWYGLLQLPLGHSRNRTLFNQDFKDMLSALSEARADFLLVGGECSPEGTKRWSHGREPHLYPHLLFLLPSPCPRPGLGERGWG